MLRARLAISLFALWSLMPQATSAQSASCDWYANTALRQQQQNEQRKCGFKGPEWHSDRRAHLTWCATQNPDRWKSQAQRREQLLAGCGR